jgi:hypothetical protein
LILHARSDKGAAPAHPFGIHVGVLVTYPGLRQSIDLRDRDVQEAGAHMGLL